MNQKPKRPPSVWISQVLVLLFGLFILVITLSLTVTVARSSVVIPIAFLVLGLYGLVGVLFLIAFWGLTKRKKFSRWLTVVLFSLTLLLLVAGQVFRPEGPMEYAEYANDTQRISGTITQVVIGLLFVFLIFRLGFGKPASNFFNPRDDAPGEMFEPPPPPSFAE